MLVDFPAGQIHTADFTVSGGGRSNVPKLAELVEASVRQCRKIGVC